MNLTVYRKLTAAGVMLLALLAASCLATRNFVRNHQAPLETRVGAVEQASNQNAQDIKALSEKTEAGIPQAQNTAEQGVQAAKAADERAVAANETAEKGLAAANQAHSMINNLQNFQAAHHTAVTFAVDKSQLTKANKQALDGVAEAVGPLKLYLIQVVGHTDSTGTNAYNPRLSQRRADAVVRYLTQKHNIPVAVVHQIGYGEDVPVASNKTKEGRSENRRVEVTVLVPQLESATAQTSATTTPPAGN
ncbi:MAG TPA: OmpA family protein [Terriglobia bacterium]|nr:OmpA family protein [Terriglobia bacterium]